MLNKNLELIELNLHILKITNNAYTVIILKFIKSEKTLYYGLLQI